MGLKQFETMTFDYVIADIDLGRNRMNGYKLTQEILEKYPSTYVLIHSNRRKEELDIEIRNDRQSRFLGFLPKPMKGDGLLNFFAGKCLGAGVGAAAFRPPESWGALKVAATMTAPKKKK